MESDKLFFFFVIMLFLLFLVEVKLVCNSKKQFYLDLVKACDLEHDNIEDTIN